ncbi:TIGR03086 family metal-binding protein [Pseudonocardia acaciae]|uniref:TIGR03086 family metal-binding protein n=1 Tax=Pseudonocardia acaciae TaxID=551276 RepID=UPI00048B4311|nr:TIGR03086 family metal-binding protein [Pseudonocardia acaciae]
MTAKYDLGPAAEQIKTLIDGVTDEHLDGPTPCAEYTVRDLLGHLLGLTAVFRNAATRTGDTAAPPEEPGTLVTGDWPARLAARLDELALAWRDPNAWEGVTGAGGVELPSSLAGTIALNELLLHGWDLARATGQPFRADPDSVRASLEFTELVNSPRWTAGRAGLFDDVVEVPSDAPDLDRTLGLSGRDPAWTP